MSLRIITKPQQIEQWITGRNGTPTRRRGTDKDFRILFGETVTEFEPVSLDELLEGIKLNNLVMLVDEEPGKTFHKIYAHS
ncbi:MAG: hypothetical protein PCFJNLEI_01436 [Verrucomicrobiae bacterium]|nr:hypothetical protein [Verrucomicrobiae bacterium]